MELNPVTSLEWLDCDIISRLGVAAILGLVLGLDREWRGHAAGMRTHGLICVSAAAMVGIACGAAQWPLVAILTVVSLIMITVLRVAEDKFGKEDRNIARSIGRSPDE